jgi:hypothetical protein
MKKIRVYEDTFDPSRLDPKKLKEAWERCSAPSPWKKDGFEPSELVHQISTFTKKGQL